MDDRALEYIITHVFCPLRLPDGDDHTVNHDHALSGAIWAPHWNRITRMLDNLSATMRFETMDAGRVTSQLNSMEVGDVLAYLIRAQNAAVVVRKNADDTIFESFEISPMAGAVMAIAVPNNVFSDPAFQSELANFLTHMNEDVLDLASTSRKAQSTVLEERDTTHPRYITELLTGILRGVGHPADVARVSKRIGDDVTWNNSRLPWRRSSLWLLIRVVLQTSLERTALGRDTYKEFMLFFMQYLAEEAINADTSSELLHFMSAKISRRLMKLGPSAPDWTLDERWKLVQDDQAASPPWTAPSQFDLSRDTQLSLLGSRGHIHKSLNNYGTDIPRTTFNPEHRPRGTLDDFLSSDGRFFSDAYLAEPHITLYDGIDDWVARVMNANDACVKLEILAYKYSSSALKTYTDNPEHLSIMLLTTMELWIALDKVVIQDIPMLAEYSPEIPTALLESLLLRDAENLSRLRHAYQYLDTRHSEARRGCFSIRYYNGFPRLQDLHARIEEAAQHEVDRKVAELESANAQHANLRQQIAATDHTYTVDWYGNDVHVKKNRCCKCQLERQLAQMEISVHEWPLPARQLDAAVVVFELDCPVSFNMWRSATFHLLVDICSPPPQRCSPSHHSRRLFCTSALSSSNTKPFVKSHYSTTRIPSTKDLVCVNNGLTFYGFDSSAQVEASNAFNNASVTRYCIHQLHTGPYQNLQGYLDGTSHTSNQVLADQADCHKELSIHEFIAFGHLRSGSSLQWLNILRELRDRTLSYRRHEIHLLLAQAVSQVGPLAETGEWTWHQEIHQPSFCPNWLEGVTMSTISMLLSRLLASGPSVEYSETALKLLRSVRTKTFSWVKELSDKLTKTPGDTGNDEFRWRLRDMAAICRSTFDAGSANIWPLLHSPEDVEILLSCAVFIHDNTPSDLSGVSASSRLLLERDRRLACLSVRVPNGRIYVVRVLAGSRATTAPTANQISQAVHFNLLDGTLLVDREAASIQMYFLIFGKVGMYFDVIPGDIPGMEFATRVRGLMYTQVYFSLRHGELVIQAKRQRTADILELIPQEMMKSDLPAVLVQGHAHWLNLSKRTIETSRENWKISLTADANDMRRGSQLFVDIRSPTWAMISGLLGPLDRPDNLIITVSPADPASPARLSVELPRYGLSFFVDGDGDLQSHNIRDMVYDKNQSTGTMFGLVNQLVLRPKVQCEEELMQRCVLIPDGDVSFKKHGHHVRIEVDTHHPPLRRVTYQTYKVDTELGCLTGNVSLTNKLYRAYLHALSSNGCSTDPLTSRTGTEEALSVLRSAGCRSFMKLEPSDAKLLCLIASLCPTRTWYPKHLQRMQNVEWSCLPASAQHHGLYTAAKAIKEHCQKVQLFHDNQPSSSFKEFPFHDEHLFDRSALRAAYLHPYEFSEYPPRADRDVKYQARDLVEPGSGEHRAYGAASAVSSGSIALETTKDILGLLESWKSMVKGSTSLSLKYDSTWLDPDLPSIWITAYNLLRQKGKAQQHFPLLFSLPAMAYRSSDLETLVQTLLAFATHPQFRLEDPPPYAAYDLSLGYSPSPDTLRHYVSNSARRFEDSPESFTPANPNETIRELRLRQRRSYDLNRLLMAWPSDTPPRISLTSDCYDNCYRNLKLKEHLARVQNILSRANSLPAPLPRYTFKPSSSIPIRMPWLVTTSSAGSTGLRNLISALWVNANTPFQHKYVDDLHDSAEQFGAEMTLAVHGTTKQARAEAEILLQRLYVQCRDNYFRGLDVLKEALSPISMDEHASVYQSGQWPRITTGALFQCLASTSTIELPEDWKSSLISLVILCLDLQRSRRLLRLVMGNPQEEFFKELENAGCEGWNAEQHPDWLLIQLQGNFLVRRVQASSGQNTGKSSVIVPIIVAALANGDQLIRVVVPKALTAQMFQLLVDRLGGLTNRRIYLFAVLTFPGDESLKGQRAPRDLGRMQRERGILVVHPDHVLSLKLMSVEKQLDENNQVAGELLKLQKWLHSHARDILDESDEILHVRYQLVYTMGLQRHVEGFPERWTTTQQILGLVKKHASSLRGRFPLGMEFESGPPGSFPHVRILEADAGQELISRIAKDVMDGLLPNFGFDQVRSRLRDAIHRFICCKEVKPSTIQMVEEHTLSSALHGGLLLLRGLLASGILLYVLKERRWRVDYGLAPARTMLAVPYRAKDIPAPKAEFGHPDVAITLTCLSYYYGGLAEAQLKTCFEILQKQDNPSLEYELWVRDCPSVPDALRSLSGVNVKSSEQWTSHLLPLFTKNQAVVDFYLSRVVFPREAKEFPSKLSCSGWDLAEHRARLITGFSGTNDGQYLLPTSISQRDPDHQRGTNARVLAYLLQPENNSYMLTAHDNGDRRTTREFLKMVVAQKPEIRVLLDVGAQMLDLQNLELAEAWLKLSPDTLAAIYFNEDDELAVLTRDGATQLLLSSPFAQQLDRCVVYLDDAHTRGTDIKFPAGFRAAVTLGPKVTKDRLTQGCMRLRKLGHGHSVMFFAPLEVDRNIRSLVSKDTSDHINVTDILQWAIRETCNDIVQRVSHWAQQGMDHASRYSAWSRFCSNNLTPEQVSTAWLQPEAKSLVDRYSPRKSGSSITLTIPEIRQRCLDLGVLSLRDASMDEEQEREVIHEIERERQVERPKKVTPAMHSIHRDVITFVKSGVVPAGTSAFRPIFATLENTMAATREAHVWSQSVLSTTINGLMPAIRLSKHVHLHVYTPRTIESMKPCDDLSLYNIPTVPLGWTPPWALVDQLNVFAGQLYLRDYATYIQLCRFLCIYAKDLKDEGDIEVQCDGFIAPSNRPLRAKPQNSFQHTPLPSLKTLVGIRRKGMRYAPTHIGKILEGRLLTEQDFQDRDNDEVYGDDKMIRTQTIMYGGMLRKFIF
ncbi:hypothetical protein BU15DRAFT_89398 [Melanogaster broomeanus]|nr:hypothetical protein BU15DRAFT_89398 [Melanogaster broomeanus]